MSYILQALKKAEAERRLGQVPDAQSVLAAADPAPPQQPAAPRSAWPWAAVAAAAVVLGAASAAWWGLARRPTAAPTPASVSAPAVPAQMPPSAAPSNPPIPPSLPAPTPPPVSTSIPSPAPMPSPAPPPPVVIELAPPPPPAPQPQPPNPAPAAAPWIDQLPAGERAGLPRLAVEGAIHAQQSADRMLLLDGQVWREGDTLAPQLTLERIERGYAVLVWRGQRLRLRL